eukprot:4082536-Pyramimonas_sp.AAC.1
MDNANRVNVAIANATRNVVITGDGRMFTTASRPRLRELPEYGRMAKLWVRFQEPNQSGRRKVLAIDTGSDLIMDLAAWVPESATLSHAGDDAIKKIDSAIDKARASMEKNFADKMAAPLDPAFCWGALGEAMQNSLLRLVEDPARGVVLYTVSGLRPHLYSIADAPREPGLFDRKAWGHLGFCYDVDLGIAASNFVYNMTWAAL